MNEKKVIRRARKAKPVRQVAAVPFRATASGREVMLITSRSTGRFVFPKGWPMKGKSRRKAAYLEAEQEAGVTGRVLDSPLGTYNYWKRLSSAIVPVEVTVYLIDVSDVRDDWKEKHERRRAWVAPGDAATLIDEPELASLVRNITLQ